MSKTFTCCELVERIKSSETWSGWKDEKKYQAVEFLSKASLKLIHKEKDENEAEKNVWDSLFCDECQKWFEEQEELQVKLIDAEIRKEVKEGAFHKDPSTQKALRKFKRQADEVAKDLERGKSPPFGKSPQE